MGICFPTDDSNKIQIVYSSTDDDNRRKRIKTESPRFDDSLSVISNYGINDNLNDAFQSSICDDDVIEPSQCETIKSQPRKSMKKSPYQKGVGLSNEQNKENEQNNIGRNDSISIDMIEHSPTMLGKNFTRINLKPTNKKPQTLLHSVVLNHSSIQDTQKEDLKAEPSKWHSKLSIKSTPRRLFENWSTNDSSSLPQQEARKKSGKKLALSRTPNTSRMKQSTISFPKVSNNQIIISNQKRYLMHLFELD